MAKKYFERDPAKAAKAVDHAMEGARRAAELTARLLAFSRQQPLDPQPVDVNKLVGSMSEMLTRTLGGNIRMETVLAGGLWRMFADPPQLESAILNLCVNGRDAMPDGGKITLETMNAHLDDSYAASSRRSPARPVCRHRRHRHRHRHGGRRDVARVRSFLHHQETRPGHRPGPVAGLWLREAIRRPREDLFRSRPGHDGQALPAPLCRRRSRYRAGAELRSPAGRQADRESSWSSKTKPACARCQCSCCATSATP